MARSPKDDPRFGELQHHAWNYRGDSPEICGPGGMGQPPLITNQSVMTDGMFTNANMFAVNDVYLKHMHNNMNVPVDNGTMPDEVLNPRPQNHQGLQNNAVLNLGNGQMVNVYYDKNNQSLMIPVSGQYELFSQPPGLRDAPQPQHSHMFTLNQDFSNDNNNVHVAEPTPASSYYNKEQSTMPTSNFLKEVLGNWEPNSTGTYSPFGQNFPLNHPDPPAMNMIQPQVSEPQIALNVGKPETNSPKRSDPLADTGNKKRIVAEVKPMRLTYSDVLAKNTKNNAQAEVTRKTKVSNNLEAKAANKINNSKSDKPAANAKPASDEGKQKLDNKKLNMTSSGSESGDINTDDTEKCQKPSKKRNRKSNMSRKWETQEEEDSFTATNDSQFIFIESQAEKPTKKNKTSHDNTKNADKSAVAEDLQPDYDDDDENDAQFVFEEGQVESLRARKKKEGRSYSHKLSKQSQEKKKANVSKWRRNKPGYLGVAQTYFENWCAATYKALVWFLYLLSDICRMSAHLSFDLCTSVFTQTYVSSQAVWRSSKAWLRRLGNNKCLLWIDNKLGHTRLGFWRQLKWFKKETESENGNDATKLNANIPLPATGEEAMKRLLACKGKDPYSILGVSVSCSDDEIKRYYRRQAFLVHPDKNQQPGAEEAFKILQHAFEHIGEPERREAYDRQALESRHVEAAWSELSQLLAQLHDKMEFAANTIRCTNCGRRHKRVLTDRPCYAARYCSSCRIRHSAKEGDIWAESSMMGLLVMYYACMDGAVYQITQWASCQKKNLKQLRPDCHVVQYRIVLGNKATAADLNQRPSACGHDPNLEEFLNNLYSKSGAPASAPAPPPADAPDKKRRSKKTKP